MMIAFAFYVAVSALAAMGAAFLGEHWPGDRAHASEAHAAGIDGFLAAHH